MNFDSFDNKILAKAYFNITGNDLDAIDMIEIKDSLNAGWLGEDTEIIWDEYKKLIKEI